MVRNVDHCPAVSCDLVIHDKFVIVGPGVYNLSNDVARVTLFHVRLAVGELHCRKVSPLKHFGRPGPAVPAGGTAVK